MDELKNFTLRDLFEKLRLSDEQFEQWLKDLKLLHTQRYCECGKAMRYKWKKNAMDPLWICNSRKNHDGKQPTKGFYEGTFFAGSHLSLKQVFEFTYYWARNMHKQRDFQFDMAIDTHTIVDWKNFCRDLTVEWFRKKSEKIGAAGATVEIDETVITRRKYNRGRIVKQQQWFFGGVERGSGRCFIVPVKRRDAATLLPIIEQYIYPGATIVSDCWASYNQIDQMPEMYQHYTVNHSENFVDPVTKQHTNTIESTWQKFKQSHKARYGTHRSLFATYLCSFLWRKEYGGPDVFFHFWSQIAQLYPITDSE